MSDSISIEGLPHLRAVLESKARELEAASIAAVSEQTDAVRADATRTAPKDTGALRASIEGSAAGSLGTVRTGIRYATFVEHGTSNTPAQPFMGPAAERARRRFPRVAADIIRKALGG